MRGRKRSWRVEDVVARGSGKTVTRHSGVLRLRKGVARGDGRAESDGTPSQEGECWGARRG